ncbi:MAG: TetR/AcrR family transcriptional regulator [Rhizobiales bacterium]|nr:TetR/AcrR family transcriptional regulator [Hyphomicrobiales bacterium]
MLDIRKQDRRILKTKRQLWSALVSLLQKTDWQDINVRMICDEANIARSSFYSHFDNKTTLLDYGFSQTVQEVETQINQTPKIEGQFVTIAWLVSHITQNFTFFKNINNSSASQTIFIKFKVTVQKMLHQEIIAAGHKCSFSEVAFIVGGCFSTIQLWIADDCNKTSNELIRLLNHLSSQIISIRGSISL